MLTACVFLLLAASLLFGMFVHLDSIGRVTEALWCGIGAGALFLTMVFLVVVWVDRANRPEPRWVPPTVAVPSYHPVKCADLAWLDGMWKCIPYDEQG